MDKGKELSKIAQQIKPMMDRLGDLTRAELTELGKLSASWVALNTEIKTEIIAALEEQIEEYELAIEIVNAFALERGLSEELEDYAAQVMDDFQKSRTTVQ